MALRKKKILFITAGAVTMVVIAVILVLLLNIKAYKPQIEAVMSSVLGMDVRIQGAMGVSFSPDFGISLHDLRVRNQESEVLTIEKVGIGLKVIRLASWEVQVVQVELVKPVFSIVRLKNGMFNFEAPGRKLREMLLAVKEISISQGSLVCRDETSGEKIEAGDLDLRIRNGVSSGTDNAEAWKNISFTADGSCGILQIKGVTVTDLVMRMVAGSGKWDIDPISMNIFGGTGMGSIHVDVTGPSPHHRVRYALTRFRIEEVLRGTSLKKFPPKNIEGRADLSADLTATGKSADEVKRSLNGDLSLGGENLMNYNVDVDALIMEYEQSQNFNLIDLGAFFLAGPFGPLLTKSYNFASLYEESQGGQGLIRKLVSVWKVKNGIAEATDVAFATRQNRVAMKGGLNFINERFVGVTVAALDRRGCAIYSEKVQGPFAKPRIEKESIFKSFAGSVLNPLKDAWRFIQGQECTVFYSGSVAQPEG